MAFLINLLKLLTQKLPPPVDYSHHEIRWMVMDGADRLVVAVNGGDITCWCVPLTESDFQSDPETVAERIVERYLRVK